MAVTIDELLAERDALLKAMWDCRTWHGFDPDFRAVAAHASIEREKTLEATLNRVRALADKWTNRPVPYEATSVGVRGHVSYVTRRSSDDYADALRAALDAA